jgi:HAD domain in Swiss Army Knife RNA repair proteins
MSRPPRPAHDRLPTVFLDVDGVLNAFRFDVEHASFGDFTDHAVTIDDQPGLGRRFDLCLSRTMGERLASLNAVIVWVTTWEHHADTYIAPLCGLPRDLSVLTSPDGVDTWHGTWKFDAVRRAVSEDPRPFVWVDDDLDAFGRGSDSARRWAADLPIENLLVSPDPRAGLTHGHLEAIEAFLEKVTRAMA